MKKEYSIQILGLCNLALFKMNVHFESQTYFQHR